MDTTEGGTTSPEPEPRIIGLTGGIGSGKSTVAKFIEDMGFPVYYSDSRAKEIVNDNGFLKSKIIDLLGTEAYNDSGNYNRKYVAGLVFGNDELLQKLNQTIHPAVREDFENWVGRQSSEFVFKETALLFELGLDKECDHSILVTAEDNLRIKRVMDRDGKTYREVETIMDKQMPEKDKIRKTVFIIYNNDGLAELRTETEKVINKIIRQEETA